MVFKTLLVQNLQERKLGIAKGEFERFVESHCFLSLKTTLVLWYSFEVIYEKKTSDEGNSFGPAII